MASIEQPEFRRLPLEDDRTKEEDSITAQLLPGERLPKDAAFRTVLGAENVKLALSQSTNVNNQVVAVFNPTEFEQSVPMDWTRMVAPGGSFSRIHFLSTRNYVLDLELYWSAFTREEVAISEKARSQLLAWTYPEFNPSGWSLGPARLHFDWPHVTNMTCYMIELRMKNLRFARNGQVTRWMATMKLEESLDSFLPTGIDSTPSLVGEKPR